MLRGQLASKLNLASYLILFVSDIFNPISYFFSRPINTTRNIHRQSAGVSSDGHRRRRTSHVSVVMETCGVCACGSKYNADHEIQISSQLSLTQAASLFL